MAVTFDAVGAGGGSAVSSVTFALTVSGANRALLVGIALRALGLGATVTGVTYNGVALTKQGGNNSYINTITQFWGLVAPDTGTNNVVVSLDTANDDVSVSAVSANGVDQTTAFGTPNGAGGSNVSPTADISAATDDLVIDCMCCDGAVGTQTPLNEGAGQTSRTEQTNRYAVQGVSTEAGAATVTMSWGIQGGVDWCTRGLAFKTAAAATTRGMPFGGGGTAFGGGRCLVGNIR